MIRLLRKRHKQVWLVWAIALPVGIIAAWLAAPDSPVVNLVQSDKSTLLPITVATKELPDYTASIRTNLANSEWQLEWKNKKALVVPSAVIYVSEQDKFSIAKSILVGRIETKASYVFPITQPENGSPLKLVLYDFIHEKILDTLFLKPQETKGGPDL